MNIIWYEYDINHEYGEYNDHNMVTSILCRSNESIWYTFIATTLYKYELVGLTYTLTFDLVCIL